MRVPSFLAQRTNINTEKRYIFYLAILGFVIVDTILTYSAMIFFAQSLKSVWLAGIFFGISSFIAMFLDIPFGYLQKVFSARKLFLIAVFGYVFTISVFLLGIAHPWILFLAALSFGLSWDMYGVTTMSWLLKGSVPSEYSQNISQKNVAEAVAMLLGLILSGILLSFANILFDNQQYITFLNQLFIFLMLIAVALFVWFFFDRDEEEIAVMKAKAAEFAANTQATPLPDEARHVLQSLSSATLSGLKTSAVTVLDVAEKGIAVIKGSLEQGRIYLKPILPSENFESKKMIAELRDAFIGIGGIFRSGQKNIPLLWVSTVLTLFSFWDTFVVTFQPLFLVQFLMKAKDTVPYLNGGLIMAALVIPLFLLQMPFARLGNRIGRSKLVIAGLLLSGGSIFLFAFATTIKFLILWGLLNSVGYAMIMPQAQAFFAEKYQEYIAYTTKNPNVDENISAGPLKMLLNFGNIFGTMMGGFLISLFGFTSFFVIFGMLLIGLFFYSMSLLSEIMKPAYVLSDEGAIQEETVPIVQLV